MPGIILLNAALFVVTMTVWEIGATVANFVADEFLYIGVLACFATVNSAYFNLALVKYYIETSGNMGHGPAKPRRSFRKT